MRVLRGISRRNNVFSRSFVAVAAFALVAGISIVTIGCGAGTGGPSHTPAGDLPPYSGAATDLFDDALDPAAVGLELDTRYDPMTDSKLRQRMQTADGALRVKVETVTEKHEDEGTTYVLELKAVEVFGGNAPPDGTFQLHVGRQSPSHGIVGSLESRLIGKTFIAAVKRFSNAGDESGDLHFHFSTDNEKTVAAVKAAFALEGFRTTTTSH